jgi:hypothetical protein
MDDLTAAADAISLSLGFGPGVVKPELLTWAFTIEFALFGLGEADRNVDNELILVNTMSQMMGVRADFITIDYYCTYCEKALQRAPRDACVGWLLTRRTP